MKMCEKCSRIVTGATECSDEDCPFPAALERGKAAAATAAIQPPPSPDEQAKSDDIAAATPRPPSQPDQSSEGELIARFCAECGGKVRAGASFCGQCGTAVVAPLSPAKADPPAPTQPPPQATPDPEPEPEPKSQSDAEPKAEPEPIRSNDTLGTSAAPPEEPEEEIAAEVALKDEPVSSGEIDEPDDQGVWEYAEEEHAYSGSGNAKWFALGAIVLLLGAAGGAWLYMKTGETNAPDSQALAGQTAEDSSPQAPMLTGRYSGFYMDQNISITIAEGEPRTLVDAGGVARYSNVVTGGRCVSRLEPVAGGGIGGDTSNAVSFSQQPVADEPACSQEIPVKIDISEQPLDSDGIVKVMAVQWLSPEGDEVLMQGELTREASE